MVMAALHPTGEVGLVGAAELPQPDSIAANPTHTGMRINVASARAGFCWAPLKAPVRLRV